jgi:hypothetical protein
VLIAELFPDVMRLKELNLINNPKKSYLQTKSL